MSEIPWDQVLAVGGIIVGVIALFIIVHKIVKFFLTLLIVAIIAAMAIWYCVRSGYISEETAGKLNPLNHEVVTDNLKKAGDWAEDKAKDAVKKVVNESVSETQSKIIKRMEEEQ